MMVPAFVSLKALSRLPEKQKELDGSGSPW